MGDPMIRRTRLNFSLAMLAAAFIASPLAAQPSAIHKTTLQEQSFPPPIYDTVTVRTVVDPGGEVPPHTHPGAEMAYIVEGSAVLTIKGAPPRPLAVGDSFSIPPQRVHSVRNTGSRALTIVSTYVVDKNQPISSPAH